MEALVRALARLLVALYYPAIAFEGREHVPTSGPVIFVLNHPNGLIDPLLLRLVTGRAARFLAKSTLFGNPFGRLGMRAFGCLPVYRVHDGGSDAAERTRRNEETFARCREALSAGEAIALFPEGTSHSDPQLRPLKTGAARIALSAERDHAQRTGAALGVQFVPVGFFYEHKTVFRSRVLLVAGPPIAVAPRLEAFAGDERAAVDDLTDEIRGALDAVVLQAESLDLLQGVARVASWTAPDQEAAQDLAERHARARTLLAAYGRLQARDPQRAEAIAAKARAFTSLLRRCGVVDPWAIERPGPAIAGATWAAVKLLLTAPLALAGALLGWVPYRLAGVVAARMTSEEDVLGTVKLLLGATFVTGTWLVEAMAAGLWQGARGVLAVLLLGPLGGWMALRAESLADTVMGAARLLWFRGTRGRDARTLVERRREIADDVARALAQDRDHPVQKRQASETPSGATPSDTERSTSGSRS